MREKFFKTSCKSYHLCEKEIAEMAKRYGLVSAVNGNLPDLILMKAKADQRKNNRKNDYEKLALAVLDSTRCREMQDTIRYVDSSFEKIRKKFGEEARSQIWDIYVEGLGIQNVGESSNPPVPLRTLNRRIKTVMTDLFPEDSNARN